MWGNWSARTAAGRNGCKVHGSGTRNFSIVSYLLCIDQRRRFFFAPHSLIQERCLRLSVSVNGSMILLLGAMRIQDKDKEKIKRKYK